MFTDTDTSSGEIGGTVVVDGTATTGIYRLYFASASDQLLGIIVESAAIAIGAVTTMSIPGSSF